MIGNKELKLLIKHALEQDNPYITKDELKTHIEEFTVAGKLSDDEKTELLGLFPQEGGTEVTS
jgi:hypothetical protein